MCYKNEFINFMYESGVLTFGDFTAKSGRKTPYFVNTGKYCEGRQAAKLGGFYADCIMENITDLRNTVLFGPAYKGIPLAVSAAVALAERGVNVKYCFNRKEEKDHGEGGNLIGHKLNSNDKVLIIEDVITAGTAVREVMPLLKGVEVAGLIISVNRMERGTGEKTAVQEIRDEFGIPTYPIVNVLEIIDALHGKGIDDATKSRMEAYIKEYCIFN